MNKILFSLFVFSPWFALAQEAPPPPALDGIQKIILDLASKFPVILSILAVIGTLRVINKPLFSFLKYLAGQTATDKDDKLLSGIEASKAYITFMYILDWFGSIKDPSKK